ncbi:MAG: polysaccharide deacetylase family protein [Angelakisella sp.]
MKVKQKKSALLPGLITVLMVVAAVAGGLRMTDPDGGRLDTMRQELETITAENEGLTAQVEALRTETAEQKALPEAIQKQKDEGFRLLGELERQIRAGESDKRIAYLTFDDGPYDNTTDAILDILKEKGCTPPSSCGTGRTMWRRSSGRYREGHTLANHSYSHKIKAVYQSADSCIKEIRDQQKWLTETVGVTPEIYRFPGGSPTAGNKKQAIAAALAADGLGYVDWNCYTGDGLPGVLTTEKAYQNAVSSVGEQKIVVMLMHDYSAATLEALPDIIDTLKAKGYMMMPLFRESVMIRSA